MIAQNLVVTVNNIRRPLQCRRKMPNRNVELYSKRTDDHYHPTVRGSEAGLQTTCDLRFVICYLLCRSRTLPDSTSLLYRPLFASPRITFSRLTHQVQRPQLPLSSTIPTSTTSTPPLPQQISRFSTKKWPPMLRLLSRTNSTSATTFPAPVPEPALAPTTLRTMSNTSTTSERGFP